MLTQLRAFGGLQSYPSRTKDPDRIDFSTGSVGLGAVAPMFAALADRYLRSHFRETAGRRPDRRFVATVGDAELDEGNVWEAVLEDSLGGLGNVTVVVDLNRQSLDRVVPGHPHPARSRGCSRPPAGRCSRRSTGDASSTASRGPGGATLTRRIDDMPNEEYQALIRRPGAEARERLLEGAPRPDATISSGRSPTPRRRPADRSSPTSAGTTSTSSSGSLRAADATRTARSVVFAYTIKGWRLPFAGDTLNHSAMLTAEQIEALAPTPERRR